MITTPIVDNIQGFPVPSAISEVDDLPITMPPLVSLWFKRSYKVMCTNCYLFYSTYDVTELCHGCTIHGRYISKWWKHWKNRQSLIKNILVINIVSKCLRISELGLHMNIMKFL